MVDRGESGVMENVQATSSASSEEEQADDQTLQSLLCPAPNELPLRPLPAIECNYTHHYALNIMGKDHHDQYVYRHANGLCIIGLAPSHVALHPTPSVTGVDFNVGKQSRAEMKACGKRKRNGHVLESNSVLCKVMSGDSFFLIRCCVKGTLLEVNEPLTRNPSLLNKQASREGYVAIMMPRPEDWAKAEKTFVNKERYLAETGLSLKG